MNKELIQNIVEKYNPKQLGLYIKKNRELHTWLLDITANLAGNPTISERVYAYINNIQTNICSPHGKIKKFKGINDGYGYCGLTRECNCAKEAVSTKISKHHAELSDETKDNIQNKRIETNFKKYGIGNAGQLPISVEKHKEFYNDKSLVEKQVMLFKKTMMAKYGVENPSNITATNEKRKSTLLSKYGVDNISKTLSRRKSLSEISKTTWIKRKSSNVDFQQLNNKFRNVCHTEFSMAPEDYKGVTGHIWYTFKCLNCSASFETYIDNGHLPICKSCHPTIHNYKSGEENEVFEFLKTLNLSVRQRDRRIIFPLELDIVSDDCKIAIEYCGLYWHSECSGKKNKDYHIQKMKLCADKGYRLITIFSDEWNFKKEIVKSKLKSIFAVNKNGIGARSCKINFIDASVADEFYKNYHIQGAAPANCHIGLFFENNLVSAMSFGKPRVFLNHTHNDQRELIRYATSTQIVGGAGKLLNFYQKNTQCNAILSYADARWSNGNLYSKLNFKLINKGNLTPGYWYTTDYSRREHRFNFTKSNLVKNGYDSSCSEWEIMQSRGYDRIWDCGQLKFLKTYR
jgi:hypothetical protein